MAMRGPRWRRLAAIAFAIPCLTGSVAATAAEAGTGGASPLAPAYAPAGEGPAFGPVRAAGATWYGPGFYGSRTACGQVLRPQTIGVANRTLPCGTPVRFEYRGRSVVARVIDRGPYTRGNSFDLTNGAREALGFDGSGQIRYAVALGFERRWSRR